ncbi:MULTISPECIES: chemotaxis protein CheC [Bacillaceae]|uniref:Chemotaxis protein CheC n=1 Tax=Peribacillus huizhouensis TaxID=1501239 RepID=A0ABR6CJG3_9BACI|nr:MULTISPECIES: chemotaxis protein CheC [Bacillaceae]MBA9024846.1 chemotaxis protein CheC [Peribacillus huizhouensis]
MSYVDKINSVHLDILKEIGNIGAGHAATSLSTILDRKMNMIVPRVRILSINEMIELAGGPETVVASVFLRIEGEVQGNMFFILPLKQAAHFIEQMTGTEVFSFDNLPYPELALSALSELGNILSGSYLSSLSDFTKLSLFPSVPALCIDMVGATISSGLIELSQVSDFVIVIETAIGEAVESSTFINGHFFFLLDPDAYEVVFNSLGVPLHG